MALMAAALMVDGVDGVEAAALMAAALMALMAAALMALMAAALMALMAAALMAWRRRR